ncbi:hypothetical protein GCM10009624_18650 [Gordonia sinesedis]
MKNSSKTVPALILGAGGLALVVVLIVSFIPWGTSGTASATAASRAQHSLDEVAFKLGTSPGARYTGTMTYKYNSGDLPTQQLSFKNLIVTSTNNAEGTLTLAGNDTQYRQIGNDQYINGPTEFWNVLLTEGEKTYLDLAPVNNKWATPRYSTLPFIGTVFNPRLISGRMANAELVNPPTLGAELPGQNSGTPDARFWPTSDPTITSLGDGKVRAGKWEISYNPDGNIVQHIKGEYVNGNVTYTVDTDVTPLGTDDVTKVFANERSIAPELTEIPAPGLVPRNPSVTSRQVGTCDPSACAYDISVTGTPSLGDDLDTPTGYFNYGMTVNFEVNNSPPGAVGGSCTEVVRAEIGRTAAARCVATNLPSSGGRIKANVDFKYLAFATTEAARINGYIDDSEKGTKRKVTMLRTGQKRQSAATYSYQWAGLPSSYVVKQGDYLFDGLGAAGAFLVTFGPGYNEHITGLTFDESWPGTKLLKDQMDQQIRAAGDARVVYFVSDPATATALRLLTIDKGTSDKITVYYQKQF